MIGKKLGQRGGRVGAATMTALLLAGGEVSFAQTAGASRSPGASAASLLRPIDSPSAVDSYRQARRTPARSDSPSIPARYASRDMRPVDVGGDPADVRQTAWMQSDSGPLAAPELPGGIDFPPGASPPAASSQPQPSGSGSSAGATATEPRTLPHYSRDDMNPVPQPQIGQVRYATMDNCSMVSPPSSYLAASGIGCGAPTASAGPATYAPSPTFAAPPAEFAAPAVMPSASPPAIAVGTGRAYHLPPLVSFGQEQNPVQVGQGLWGQPVAYVPGQGVRNFMRYWFP